MADVTDAQERAEILIRDAAMEWSRTVTRPSSVQAFTAGARWMAHTIDARLKTRGEQQPPASCPNCGGTWWQGDPPLCMKCHVVAPGWEVPAGVQAGSPAADRERDGGGDAG